MSQFTIDIKEAGRPGPARLALIGELDVCTASSFRRELRAMRATNRDVCVDLSQLEFIDCAGVRALDDVFAQSQEGGWSVELAPDISDQARRFFDLIMAAGVPASF